MPPPSLKISTISLETFNATLARYPSIAPAKLKDLDTLRYVTVPARLAKQKTELGEGKVCLEKEELEGLVEWKLKHGTFRPRLLALVQGNSLKSIRDLTRAAYATLDVADSASVMASLKCVIGLTGIGPATASLVLSVYDSDAVPFFSDELFRWVTWGKEGWKKKIKYNTKEYAVLFEGAGKLRERLGVRSVDVERVAWVLGKEGRDVGEEDGEEEEMKEEEVKEEENLEKVKKMTKFWEEKGGRKEVKQSVKRKTQDPISPSEGVRRSTRRKVES